MKTPPKTKFPPIIVFGLTGIIATGKSTYANILREKGYRIINADQIAHRAYLPGTACYEKIRGYFGNSVIGSNNEINRSVLGKIVFSDPQKMKRLTDFVWTPTRALLEESIESFQKELLNVREIPPTIGGGGEYTKSTILVIEAAVLVEAGWHHLVDAVIYVHVNDMEIIKSRLKERHPNLSEQDISKRISTQTSKETSLNKLKEAHIPVEEVDATPSIKLVAEDVEYKMLDLWKRLTSK